MNQLTEKEFLNFLETAKKAGSRRIEIQSICIVFGEEKQAVLVGQPAPEKFQFPVKKSSAKPANRQDDLECRDCGSNEMRKSQFGPGNYCHDCYRDKLEARK